MSVELLGANPIVTLVSGSERTGVMSMWDAAWSAHGAGRALLVWTTGDEAVRLLSPEPDLARWLVDTFSRYFPEFDGLPTRFQLMSCEFPEWYIEQNRAGVQAVAADGSTVAASIGRPIQTRPAYAPSMRLGTARWVLTNLLTFCGDAVLELDGRQVDGRPRTSRDGPRTSSTAFIATHETWIRHAETDT